MGKWRSCHFSEVGDVISFLVLLVFICEKARIRPESSGVGRSYISSKKALEVGRNGFL